MSLKKQINLMCVSFIVVGFVVSLFAVCEYLEIRQSKTWPIVKGAIVVSKLNNRVRTSGSNAALIYSTKINFTYMVNGKEYIGDRVRFGSNETHDPEDAAYLKNKYNVDSIVDVYYNPKEPSESVLEPLRNTALGSLVLITVAGPGCFVFGIVIFIFRNKFIE